MNRSLSFFLLLSGCYSAFADSPRGIIDTDEPQSGEYRVTLFPYHKWTDELTGFGYLGYVTNPDEDYTTDYVGYGFSYLSSPNIQLWGGLIGTYTDNEFSANRLELRPFVGVKTFLQNERRWNLYNYTRLEYRALQNRDTDDWDPYTRLRSRFGVEIPLTKPADAWQPGTWYASADAEAFYRFDRRQIDPLRLRVGIAHVFSDRVRAEFIYHMQWTRPTGGDLAYTDNIFRLNIKIGLQRGVLPRVMDGGDGFD